MGKKKQAMRALVIILVIIGFLYISERFQEEEKTSLSVDEDVFDVAHSIDELHAKQREKMDPYQASLLNRVYRYNLTNEYDDTDIPVMELNRDVKVHETWNDMFRIYFMYSVNLLPGDDRPDTIPKLDFKGLTLHNENGDTINLKTDYLLHGQNGFSPLSEGVVYNGRLYRALWINPQVSEPQIQKFLQWSGGNSLDFSELNRGFEKIDQVTFNDAFLTDKNEQETQLEDISLRMDFSNGSEKALADIPVDQTVQLENGNTIKFKSLEVGLRYNRLYLDTSQNGLGQLEYVMNGMFHSTSIMKDENGKQFIQLQDDMADRKDDFEFQFKRAVTYSDHELHATITNDELSTFKSKMEKAEKDVNIPLNRTIGNVDQTEYILQQLTETDDGPGNGVGFELVLNEAGDTSGDFINFEDYTRFKDDLENHPSLHYSFPFSLIELTDSDGNPVPIDFNIHHQGAMFFGIEQQTFLKLKELNIRLFRLPSRLEIDDNQFSIALPKELQSKGK